MGDAADMPELEVDVSALGVNRLGDLFPAGHLLGGVDAGGVRIAIAVGGDGGCLGDDEDGRGALGLILDVEFMRHMTLGSPATRERRHEDPVWQGEGAEMDGSEEVGLGHGKGFGGEDCQC
jgi:hypothetical protein